MSADKENCSPVQNRDAMSSVVGLALDCLNEGIGS